MTSSAEAAEEQRIMAAKEGGRARLRLTPPLFPQDDPDKILRQIAYPAFGLTHSLPQNFPVGVRIIGICPPTGTEFLTFSRVRGL